MHTPQATQNFCSTNASFFIGSSFLTRTIRRDILRRQQILHQGPDLSDALTTHGVMDPFPLLAAGDDPGIAEDLHVVGQGRLADVQLLQQLTGALLAAMEQPQISYPVLITQRLENEGHFLFRERQSATSHRYLSI